MPERQIGDNIVVIQEIMHSMRPKKGKKGWMAIKIDLEKAYDRLKWSFINETLEDIQMPHLHVHGFMWCVTTCSLSILWNEEPTKRFRPMRGIQ